MSALLQVRNLVKHFPVRKGLFGRRIGLVKAVDDLSFDVAAGETLALVGESGCGKSTTGRCVLRLIDPTSGSVMFDGVDVMTLNDGQMRAKRRDMQIIFQDPYASLNPRMTVAEILGEPLRLHGLASGAGVATRIGELMALVGLSPGYSRRYPHEFSGGQRQRIGIARALAVEPRLIIGDEPVSALDVSIQAQVINLLADLKARFKLAFVLIAHDLAVVKHVADRVAVMYLGKIVEIADKRSLFAQPRHPYTRALLAAIPRPDPSRKRNQPLLQGDVPSPLDPPSGCRFHTRCPYAQERCRIDDPALSPDAAGHATACHFWPTLPPAEGITTNAAPGHERLAKLQRYFVEGRGVATPPPAA